MAINPFQLPQQGAIDARVDWTPLQNLIAQYNQNRLFANAVGARTDIYGNLINPSAAGPIPAPSSLPPPPPAPAGGVPPYGGTAPIGQVQTASLLPIEQTPTAAPSPVSQAAPQGPTTPYQRFENWLHGIHTAITPTTANMLGSATDPAISSPLYPMLMQLAQGDVLNKHVIGGVQPSVPATPAAPAAPGPWTTASIGPTPPPDWQAYRTGPTPPQTPFTPTPETQPAPTATALPTSERQRDAVGKVVTELKAQGYTDNAIAGILFNLKVESNFDPTSRAPDQPRFGGEAHYAHGLFQEGGDEWNRFASDPNRAANWQDPTEQTRYVANRLRDTDYANVYQALQNAKTPEEAAKIFARGYLRPAASQLTSRNAMIDKGIPGLSAYAEGLPLEITQGRPAGAPQPPQGATVPSAPAGAPAAGVTTPPPAAPGQQLFQPPQGIPGGAGLPALTRDQFAALARNPLTAPLAQKYLEQRLMPERVDMGTDPWTGQKMFGFQVGNTIVPANIQGGEGAAGAAGNPAQMIDQMQAQGATREQMIAALPTNFRNYVDALLKGEEMPSDISNRGNLREMVFNIARKIDPNFSPANIPTMMQMRKDFAGEGKYGQSIQFMNTMQHHAEDASDALERVIKAGGTNFPSINAAKYYLSQHTSYNPELRDALKTYDDFINTTKHEMEHTYSSYVTDADRKTWDKLGSDAPVDVLRRELYDYAHAVNGKRDELNRTYAQTFHKDAPLINRQLNEHVTDKLTSRLPDYAPEKKALVEKYGQEGVTALASGEGASRAAGIQSGTADSGTGKNIPWRIKGQ